MLPLWPLVSANPTVPIPSMRLLVSNPSRRLLVFSTLEIPKGTQPLGDPGIISPNHTLDQTYDQTSQFILSDTQTLRLLLLQTKCSHLTLGFLHRRSTKQTLPIATAAPQPPGHGNIFFCSIIIWTLLCILHGSFNTLCTDLTVGVPLAGTPSVKDFTFII